MAKRQERLHGPKAITSNKNVLIGLKVSLVLKNKAVFFVEIVGLDDKHLQVKDMRLQMQQIALGDIEEIIIDRTAE